MISLVEMLAFATFIINLIKLVIEIDDRKK